MPKKYIISLGIFIVLYATLILLIPPNDALLESFEISSTQLKFIYVSLLLLLSFIWYAAFYGFSKCKEYALKIIDSSDGRAFNTLANGLGLLAFALPITSLASVALSYFARIAPQFTPATVITDRYITLSLAIVAMFFIYRGSTNLAALTNKKFTGSVYFWVGTVAILIMGALYAYTALTNTAGDVPTPVNSKAIYYLPPWMIVTTYIIPYVCIWLAGLKAIALILFFTKNTQGLIYRRPLISVARGLGMVVGGSIIVQIFTALGNSPTSWGLQLLLLFVYIVVVFIAIGYLLIALGAKKLKMIEEV